MSGYVWSLIAASMAVAIVMAVAPKGVLRPLLGTVAGLLMILALIKPLPAMPEIPKLSTESYALPTDSGAAELKTIIREKTSAYILAKAKELGLDTTAEVVLDENNNPWGVTLSVSDKRLTAIIENDLGIPAERQVTDYR
ncbi:hypothetical protein FACS1894217_06020 [Clostridia bacterium]|nr:hypothetical protein FACS1894217_06020 [Clostridia bacterium]